MPADSLYIAIIQQYEEASNRHDIDTCTALFSEDGRIEMNGEIYQGAQALRAAHEYDAGSHTTVAFRDFLVEGDTIHCTFWNEHALDRVIGTGGTTARATFTLRGEQIVCFNILSPDEDELQRVRSIVRPAFVWLRENHPEVVARWGSFDRAGGETVFALAELWRAHRDSTQSDQSSA